MYSVLLMTVFWDLIWGVLIGMFIANLLTVDSITQVQLENIEADNPLDHEKSDPATNNLSDEEQILFDQCQGGVMLFSLRGPLSFGAAKGISDRMGLVENYKVLILDISNVPHLGVTATLAIERMVQEAKTNARQAYVVGATGKVEKRLRQFGVGNLLAKRLEALQLATQLINDSQE